MVRIAREIAGHGTHTPGLGAHRAVLHGRGPARVHRVRFGGPVGDPDPRAADGAPDVPAVGTCAGRRGTARDHPRPARARSLASPGRPNGLFEPGLRYAGARTA